MKNYVHIEHLELEGCHIELGFYRNDAGGYNCDILKGYTGAGSSTGGLLTLPEAINEGVKQHEYCFYFFNCVDKQNRAQEYFEKFGQ